MLLTVGEINDLHREIMLKVSHVAESIVIPFFIAHWLWVRSMIFTQRSRWKCHRLQHLLQNHFSQQTQVPNTANSMFYIPPYSSTQHSATQLLVNFIHRHDFLHVYFFFNMVPTTTWLYTNHIFQVCPSNKYKTIWLKHTHTQAFCKYYINILRSFTSPVVPFLLWQTLPLYVWVVYAAVANRLSYIML